MSPLPDHLTFGGSPPSNHIGKPAGVTTCIGGDADDILGPFVRARHAAETQKGKPFEIHIQGESQQAIADSALALYLGKHVTQEVGIRAGPFGKLYKVGIGLHCDHSAVVTLRHRPYHSVYTLYLQATHDEATNPVCTRYDQDMELEPIDQFISMARAAQLADVSPHTLRNQARAGKLRTVKLGHDLVTSRRWLHEYLMSRNTQRGRTRPLPVDYRAPE